MDFIYYYIKVRLKLLFRNTNNTSLRLIVFFTFLSFIVYAFFLSNYLNRLVNKGIIQWGNIFFYIYYGALVLVFISFLFPRYKTCKEIFSRIYPINTFSRALTGLISDLLSEFVIILSVIVLILILSFKIPFLNRIYYAGCLLLGIINSVIFCRNVRFLIERDFFKTIYRISGWLLMFVICAGFLIFINKYNNSLLFNTLITIISFGFLVVLNKWTYDKRIIDRGPHLPLFLQLFTRNKIFRVSVLLMFLIKSIIILFFFFLFKIDPDINIAFKIPIILYTSPILIFTYLYNNFFGFFPGFITSFKIANSNHVSFIGFFLKSVFPLIFFDWLLSLGFIMIGKYDLPSWLLFYISVLLVLMPISFHLSAFKTNLIKSTFSSSNNRPFLNSFSMIPALIATLCYIYFQSFMPVVFLLYCIISITIIRAFIIKYRKEFILPYKNLQLLQAADIVMEK